MTTARRLLAVIWPFLVIVVLLLSIAEVRTSMLAGVRAYVLGESHWLRAQKTAFMDLHHYAETGDESYYRHFLEVIKVPLGDRAAREAMMMPNADFDRVREGLLSGGNDPADVHRMMGLFKYFSGLPDMAKAINMWQQSDAEISQLISAAATLHAQIDAGTALDSQAVRDSMARIDAISAQLAPMEEKFSTLLSSASRRMQAQLQWATLGATVLMLLLGLYVAWRAVRAQLRVERALRASEQRYALVAEGANDGIWEWELDSGRVFHSPRVHDMLGYGPDELNQSDSLERIMSEDEFTPAAEALKTHIRDGNTGVLRRTIRMRTKDGKRLSILSRSTNQYDANGKPLRVAGSYTDITEQVETENKLRLAASVFEAGYEGILITDPKNRVVDANHAFLDLSGFTREQLIGRAAHELYAPGVPGTVREEALATVQETGAWRGEVIGRKRNGDDLPLEMSIVTVRDAAGHVLYRINACRDIAERKYAQARIQHLAYFDALTGLPNRSYLGAHFDALLTAAEVSRKPLAVVFFDLDGFKEVNDTLGHSAGDTLIKLVGQRLRSLLTDTDLLCRFGGDEFLLVLPNRDHAAARTLAEQLIARISEPLELEGRSLTTTASAGFSMFPEDGTDAENLVRQADMALYKAKDAGKNIVVRYVTEMSTAVAWRQDMLGALREAVAEKQFVLRFQPVMDVNRGCVAGVEALVYWNHPQTGVIGPSSFIPLAEESGLIEQLGAWVVEEALRCHAAWHAAGLPHFYLAINLSGFQLRNAQVLRERLVAAAHHHGVPITDVVLEITERQIVYDMNTSLPVLTSLSAHGIGLAIDDFGTGYSSLEYLRDLPVTQIKIDMIFVRNVVAEMGDRAIVNAIIGLGRSLRLQVVAEGVETAEQLKVLQDAGCHLIQGFLFSRPLPADELAAFVQTLETQRTKADIDQNYPVYARPSDE